MWDKQISRKPNTLKRIVIKPTPHVIYREDAFLFTLFFSISQQGMQKISLTQNNTFRNKKSLLSPKNQTGQDPTHHPELTSKQTSARTQFMELPKVHEEQKKKENSPQI